MNYDWLLEVYDTDSGRSIGRVWTSRFYWANCLRLHLLPLTCMVRRLDPISLESATHARRCARCGCVKNGT